MPRHLPRRAGLPLLAAALALPLAAAHRPGPASAAWPASATVTPGDPATCATDPSLAKHEMRGMWIASVVNIDWPSRQGLSPAQSQAELVKLLDLARANRMNTVVLQVRPTADTFWPSSLEPWSQWLTGTQGKDPGWDPMAFAVQQAHLRGLELHAWVNPYRVAMDARGSRLAASHPARRHPEWTVPYGGKLYYNPGLPAVRRHVVGVITELVTRYDVDAVHFDDYFYPYPVDGQAFDDSAAYRAYGAGRSLAAWRRANITALIDDTRTAVRRARPGTQFGVSPFGVWRNAATDATGSDTRAGVQTYDDLYADTRAWMLNGQVDYLVPQDYWSTSLKAAPYGAVAGWWSGVAASSPRSNLYLGEAAYKVDPASTDPVWRTSTELASHFGLTDALNAVAGPMRASGGPVKGRMWFSASDVAANRADAMGTVVRGRYTRPALTPRTPWLDAIAPASPMVGRTGATIQIRPTRAAHQYVVYRVAKPAREVTACDLADTRNVVAVLNGTSRAWTDTQVPPTSGTTWLVSAVDRASNESPARIVG